MGTDKLISSLKGLQDIENKLKDPNSKWIFRAEKYFKRERDGLRTKIEIAFDLYGIKDKDKPNTEKDLIREFQRKLHLYSNNLPVRNDIPQWLALMQHYGAPTRMIDFTYSFWVAVFFAISRIKIGEKGVIWALNTDADEIASELKTIEDSVDEAIKEIVEKDKSLTYCDKRLIEDCAVIFSILENKRDGFYIANPFRLNDRLTIQQGTFVIPCNIKKSFQQNVKVSKKVKSGLMKKYVLVINRKFQKDLLSHLRQMNINSAVLFPGLQGFAESLWMRAGRPMKDKLSGNEQKDKLQLYTNPET